MRKVRVGIVGLGFMGRKHFSYFTKGKISMAELTAVCDIDPECLKWAKENSGGSILTFDNADALLESGIVDGILIAVPHYFHPEIAIKAFSKGIHVLSEKPAGVYTKQVKKMNNAAEKSKKVFSIMFQKRTDPIYYKVKELIASGELGELKRSIMIATFHYRSQSYYDSGGWRATWAGEGGGVLINQDPHEIDLWQWICGMPKKVHAFCSIGKFHDIEVEDDVTAYVEYENNATGVFISSTGDSPGTRRFEIIGDKGKIVVENNALFFWKLRIPERKFNKEYKGGLGEPECWKCEIPVNHSAESGHHVIINNWVDAILNRTALISPGIEGINSLQISNAMYLSSWIKNTVEIPIDDDFYYEQLKKRIEKSK
jgi:predicted dehydrogenase